MAETTQDASVDPATLDQTSRKDIRQPPENRPEAPRWDVLKKRECSSSQHKCSNFKGVELSVKQHTKDGEAILMRKKSLGNSFSRARVGELETSPVAQIQNFGGATRDRCTGA